jgi:hypothetical protein
MHARLRNLSRTAISLLPAGLAVFTVVIDGAKRW